MKPNVVLLIQTQIICCKIQPTESVTEFTTNYKQSTPIINQSIIRSCS